jgi:hypothetical protein
VGPEATVGDEDDDVRWLNESSFTSPKPSLHIYPVDQLALEVPVSPPPPVLQWMFRAVRVSAHDPPWATPPGLRAPPCLFA